MGRVSALRRPGHPHTTGRRTSRRPRSSPMAHSGLWATRTAAVIIAIMNVLPDVTSSSAVARRTLLKGVGLGGAAAALAGLSGCTADPAPAAASDPSAGVGSAAPASAATGEIDAAGVERGLAALPAIIDRYWKQTGIPGVAVAVVYDGKVRYLEGFGERQVGKPETVDPDTVFQLASVSKPISSTVVGAAFTKKLSSIGWDDPVQKVLPGFRLSDPWVNSHVTAADLFAHRSGLPDHSGNLLEDLGYDRDEILSRHRYYPLKRFRDNWEYTNYGLTAGRGGDRQRQRGGLGGSCSGGALQAPRHDEQQLRLRRSAETGEPGGDAHPDRREVGAEPRGRLRSAGSCRLSQLLSAGHGRRG